jgi:hypothetical protein
MTLVGWGLGKIGSLPVTSSSSTTLNCTHSS